MSFNRKFSNLLLILALVFLLSTQLAEAKGAVAVVTAVVVVVAVVAVAVVAAAAVAQIGLAAAPSVFTTLAGTAIVGAVMVGAGLLAADCIFDKSSISANPIDPNIICTNREGRGGGGAGQQPAPSADCVICTLYGENGTYSGCFTPGECAAKQSVYPGHVFEEGPCVCEQAGPPPPPPPSVNLMGPPVVEIPDPIQLGWGSSNADSCSASGNWSGSKATSGSETIKAKTTTADRGTYNFSLSCSGPGGTASDSVNVKVIQVPRCDFTTDPSSIIPPQASTLSWSCQYADTCSIDQGIGSVNPNSGTKEVRPAQTTAYTLTCSGLDGSRSYEATVTVGFQPRLREVIPR